MSQPALNIVQFPTSGGRVKENRRGGFVALYRSIRKDARLSIASRRALWIELLCQASYEREEVVFMGQRITLEPGQLTTTYNILGDNIRDDDNRAMSKEAVRRRLKFFQDEGMISVESHSGRNGYLLITILNYTAYQNVSGDTLPDTLLDTSNASGGAGLNGISNTLPDTLPDTQNNHITITNSPKGEGDRLPAASDEPQQGNQSQSQQVESQQTDNPQKSRCPVTAIVALYHRVLPELPEVKMLTDTRRKYIQARWNEKANRQTLDFWERYFEYVRQSPFLMGQTDGSHGKPPFRADLEWLVRPSNFAKVIEEKYHA
ncbi:hypothetical protein [Oceanisphaera sp. KMM 10153]|uniref:hypothetical protein n=1 Tax=Oceanisphaera submarina TaxID=3390193 RepID=UPI0039771C49